MTLTFCFIGGAMRNLPRPARLYLLLVCLLGALVLATVWTVPLPHAFGELWEVAVFAVLAILAGSKKIRLIPNKAAAEGSSMSLGFAITFASMLRFGPAVGCLIAISSTLSACLYPRRQALHQLAFNVCLSVLETGGGGLVFLALNGWTLALRPVETFVAVSGAALAHFAINTGGVAIIVALCSGRKAWPLWHDTFLWTAPSFFASASISTLAMVLFGRHASMILMFVAPVAYLTYQSYAVSVARAEEKQQHIEELQLNQAQLADLYLATIKSLALAIDAKDQYTHQHILRVQRYAVAIARHMGVSGTELEGVNTGALLHDIGKLGVPEYVLLKPGRLTEDELEKIKKHPEIGAAILDPVEFPWPVLPVVKYHHEKWDGTGYPEGLKGEEIPRTARILAVADVYDALTSTRSYRSAWTHERAVETIRTDAGTHFDPQVVDAFLEVIGGVVEEMASEGTGPLVHSRAGEPEASSKAAQAVRDIQRASSELWALYEVAQTLSSSLGLQETIEILTHKLEAIFPGVTCAFLLQEESGPGLRVRSAAGLNREFFVESRTLSESSRSFIAASRRQTYRGCFDHDDLLLSSCPMSQWQPLRSALIVPIAHQGEVLGAINLYHPDEDAFGPYDQQLLETIAERAALAVYNGLLFDRTRGDAFTDPLTGVYNIRFFTRYLEDRIAAAEGKLERRSSTRWRQRSQGGAPLASGPFALLCLDLDSFKPINDNFGHQKGDAVLCQLAGIFRATVGKHDLVARYGGDEFLVLVEGAGALEADALAARLQTAVESFDVDLIHYKLGVLRLGVSIGIACFPADGADVASLLSAADSRMYAQKTERKLGNLAVRERLGA